MDSLLYVTLFQNSKFLNEIIEINLLALRTGISIMKANMPVRTGDAAQGQNAAGFWV